ncbi:MAG TPA: hypothetical protein VGC79_06435, partial [Polyangiaceae bacterium]
MEVQVLSFAPAKALEVAQLFEGFFFRRLRRFPPVFGRSQERLAERRASAVEGAIDSVLRAGLRAIVGRMGSPTPRQTLQVLETIFPDRLVVLPEAHKSAEV